MNPTKVVLQFTKLQFVGNWIRREGGEVAIYNALDSKGSTLSVVWQGATGNEKTYRFNVPPTPDVQHNVDPNFGVWVNWAQNLVHIPVNCIMESPGDGTKCGG